MRKFLTTGLFGAILGLAVGAPADAALVSRGFLDEALENYATTTALDLKANQSDFTDLSDKIGTLPDGVTVQGMYEGWTDENGMLANPGLKGMYDGWTDSRGNYLPGLYNLSKSETLLLNAYKSDSVLLLLQGAKATTIDGVDYTGPVYPLWKLSEGIDKIGTLPRGGLPEGNTAMYDLFKLTQDTDTPVYPVSLSDLINQLYGSTEGAPGAIAYLLKGFVFTLGEYSGPVGVLPAMELSLSATQAAKTALATATEAKTAADANTAKIGLLPPDTTVAGMMGNPVLLNREHTIIPLSELIVAGSNGQMVVNPITGDALPIPLLGLLDITAKVNKIGELPTEYATVGAALTAIKGIAEDAKAAALAAIPDPKAEGSTGKFVLTVDIVGDNATYRWEKIDREGEATTTE